MVTSSRLRLAWAKDCFFSPSCFVRPFLFQIISIAIVSGRVKRKIGFEWKLNAGGAWANNLGELAIRVRSTADLRRSTT